MFVGLHGIVHSGAQTCENQCAKVMEMGPKGTAVRVNDAVPLNLSSNAAGKLDEVGCDFATRCGGYRVCVETLVAVAAYWRPGSLLEGLPFFSPILR